VLAAVAAGLYVGFRADDISSAEVRLRSEPFWEALTYVLESVLFLLIGLQFLLIARDLPGASAWTPVGQAAAVLATAVLLRFAWMFTFGRGLSLLGRVIPGHVERLDRAELAVLGFSGMRGALSLAGALSIPLLAAARAFPAREQVIFLVYAIVLGTLIVPSLTLERLVRRLGLAQSERLREQEIEARCRLARAALERLDELAAAGEDPEGSLDHLRAVYALRLHRLETQGVSGDRGRAQEVRWELLAAERQALERMRVERTLSSEALARVAHDIDLDEARLRR
jgi:CPA1 family monovalent cation:H+ antiporter